jgi:tRNA modification GTPase
MPTLIEDTIAAISTPLGRGGLGVIRLSGPEAQTIVEKLLPKEKKLKDRAALSSAIADPQNGKEFDQAVITLFKGPRSYTREDVVEISCHGSPVLLQALLGCLLTQGARLASPGEFTLRAFLRGRIDLVQAEAIRDLIEAKTLFQARIAHQQAMGSLSKRIQPVKQKLVELIAQLEAGIDFADDDVASMTPGEIEPSISGIAADLEKLIKSFDLGKLLAEGMSIAIVGRPNVGKSSLFNALLARDRAIVTEIAGTTRDVIAENLQIRGVPVRLQDTAGIREGGDLTEKIGIDKTLETLAEADLLLLVLDGSVPCQAEDLRIIEKQENRPVHLVINKADLAPQLRLEPLPENAKSATWVSALTGQGIEELKGKIIPEFNPEQTGIEEESLVTNLRQQHHLMEALNWMQEALHTNVCHNMHELLLVDLYAALKALNALTGETTVEDILGNIFAKFCVGK